MQPIAMLGFKPKVAEYGDTETFTNVISWYISVTL